MLKKQIISKEDDQKVLQFKISLLNIKPTIWRRILVPKTYTFFELYCAIEGAMGWSGGHLHAFAISQPSTTQAIYIEWSNPDSFYDSYGRKSRDERIEKIDKYFGKLIKQCQYEYDFGDGWQHTVLLERELSIDPKISYPICIAGKYACPPDDCGGPWGYEELKETLAKPSKSQRQKEMLEWLGLDHAWEFDPTEFEPSDVEFIPPAERIKDWIDYR